MLAPGSQHSPDSGDSMAGKKKPAGSRESYNTQRTINVHDPVTAQNPSCDIRAATCCIDDPAAFLRKIRTIAESFDTHIVCFNTSMLAGQRHARAALHHAVRSYHDGSMVSNTLEMEALLNAAGSRQCTIAARFGVHSGENQMYICCYPVRDGIWDNLFPLLNFNGEEDADLIDPQKQAYLMELFGITPEELATTHGDRIVDLVLERIALLEVYR